MAFMGEVWRITPTVLTIVVTAALVLAVRWALQDRAKKHRPGDTRPNPSHQTLVEALPAEVLCEVLTFVCLKDASAISAINRKTAIQLWDSAEAWIALSPYYGLQLPLAGACDTPGSMRQVFRRSLHRIDGSHLRYLVAGLSSSASETQTSIELLLAEAEHMARGLLPQDGTEAVQELCDSVEQALLLHDHTHKGMSAAVRQFMEIARFRSDLFTYAELDLFERAIDNAVELTGLLDASVSKCQDVSPGSFGCASFSLPEVDRNLLGGYDEDAAFELQRLQLLDNLFEELEHAA